MTEIVLYVAAVPAAVLGVYVLGWMFSRGYHRGKREFLARIKSEHCSN